MKISYALFAVMCLGLGGCTASMPIETGYPISYQHKMRSAHHWDVMAMDVADWLHDSLIGPPIAPGQSPRPASDSRPGVVVHIQQPKAPSEAAVAFYDLLATRLVERGFVVTANPAGGLPIFYDMRVVTAGLPDTPKPEVILNVTVMNADRYLIRYSNIYYIGDKSQYIAMQPLTPSPSRMIDIVGCLSGIQCQ